MIRRWSGLVLAALVFVGLPASAQKALAPGGSFLDDDHLPAEPSIEALHANQITAGCGPEIFCPDRAVTRAESATFLTRAMGLGPSGGSPPFADLAPAAWYSGYVTRLHDLGVVAGYPDGTFRPEAAITRAEMAALLVRGLGLDPLEASGSFSDVATNDWYSPFVEALAAAGITAGCGNGQFCPADLVLRQHMALFLVRAFDLIPIIPPARYAPLNGLPVPDGFAVRRRVIAVKIDNAAGARPQSGIERADGMVELPVEGELTRLIGLFHQSDSGYVGPVRSARPTDELLVSLGATAAISGAQPWIADQVAAQGLRIIRENQVRPPIMFRISTRVAPYNLYTSTLELRGEADRRGYADNPPPDLFRYGAFAYDRAPAASTILMSWSDPIQVTWRWDGGRYVRSMAGAVHSWRDQAGMTAQIAATNLIVIYGRRYLVTPPTGVSGSPVPAIETIGSGRMLLFSHGRVVEGTWTRPDNTTWFSFQVGGSELVVPPGVPWISIFPEDRPVTWS